MSLALISLFATLFASPEANAPSVTALIRQFEATYHSCRTMQANFLETYFDNEKVVRSEAGVAYFARPGKMRWEYDSPERNLYLVDGKWAWFYVPADHTVTRVRAKQSSDSRTPLALLAGEMKVSRICASVTLDSSSRIADPTGVVLRCILRGPEEKSPTPSTSPGSPPDARGDYVLFELNPRDGELLRILVVDSGGVQVEFRFSNWEFDPHLEASKFHFQPSEGVAIVDGELGAAPDTPGRKPGR